MTKDENSSDLLLKQVSILTERLGKAFIFLKENLNENGCWSYGKGEPTDLHLSALSIAAIKRIQDHDSNIILENALPHLKDIISNNENKFDENNLIDSLNIIIDFSPRMIELEKGIVSRLVELRRENGWGRPEPSLSLTCRALLALMQSDFSPKDIINNYIKQLVLAQNPEDGGWGHKKGKGEFITTLHVLRTLHYSKDSSLENAISRAKNYLNGIIEDSKWLEEQDNFIIATVLYTLGYMESKHYDVINSLTIKLYQNMNPDGGWGLAKDLPSEIEYTALSLSALISVGENKFISANIVKSALNSLESKQKYYDQELKNYSNNIDILVNTKIANIIQQRNDCQQQLSDFNQKNEELNLKKESLNREITELIRQNTDLKSSLDMCEKKIEEQNASIDLHKIRISQIESRWGLISTSLKIIGIGGAFLILYLIYSLNYGQLLHLDFNIDWIYLIKFVGLLLLVIISFIITAGYSFEELEYRFSNDLTPIAIAVLLGLLVSSLIVIISKYYLEDLWQTLAPFASFGAIETIMIILAGIILISQFIIFDRLNSIQDFVHDNSRQRLHSEFDYESSYLTAKLHNIMSGWPPSKRVTFILNISEMTSPSNLELDQLARSFAEDESDRINLSLTLDRLFQMPSIFRSEVFYDLRQRFL